MGLINCGIRKVDGFLYLDVRSELGIASIRLKNAGIKKSKIVNQWYEDNQHQTPNKEIDDLPEASKFIPPERKIG
jgi:hypothetical protein